MTETDTINKDKNEDNDEDQEKAFSSAFKNKRLTGNPITAVIKNKKLGTPSNI